MYLCKHRCHLRSKIWWFTSSAIHNTYRNLLRSSSLQEPRYPLLTVVINCKIFPERKILAILQIKHWIVKYWMVRRWSSLLIPVGINVLQPFRSGSTQRFYTSLPRVNSQTLPLAHYVLKEHCLYKSEVFLKQWVTWITITNIHASLREKI